MNKRFLLFVSLLGFTFLQAKSIVISDSIESIAIREIYDFFEDPADTASFSFVQEHAAFQQFNGQIPNFGTSKSSFWIRVAVTNKAEKKRFVFQVLNPVLNVLDFYYPNNGGYDVIQTGISRPFRSRKYYDNTFLFDLSQNVGEETYYYFKIRSRDNIVFPLSIFEEDQIFEQSRKKYTVFGIFIGLMLVMLFYNLFIYFTVRDRSYIFYAIYLFFVVLTQVGDQGLTFQYLWPNTPKMAILSTFLFPPLTAMSGMMFMRVFLETKKYSIKMDRIFYVICGLYGVMFVFLLMRNYSISFKMIEVISGITSIYMLTFAAMIARTGNRTAKIFLFAWTIFLLGVTVYILKGLGILPYNYFTVYTMPIGSGVEVVLLSFALADRIRTLKKEKEESQARELEASRQNEKLIEEQNVYLEKKVNERTLALQEANKQLENTLDKLKNAQSQLVEQEKMASLGQLTAGIAHEVNNPINFVINNIKPLRLDVDDIFAMIEDVDDMIKDQEGLRKQLNDIKENIDYDFVKKEINELMDGITEGARRTAEIVKGLKNFSRLDEEECKLADMEESLSATLTLLNTRLRDVIRIEKDFCEQNLIECYPGKLNQVFMNVLSNAIDALEQKQKKMPETFVPEIRIQTKRDQDQLLVTIADNGIGMSEETKRKVFDPFFTTKDVGKGTGLGMSIVFKIMEKHNGHIEINSTEGVGTEFILYLPVKQPAMPM